MPPEALGSQKVPGQPSVKISLSAAGIDIIAGGELERTQFADTDDDRFLHPNMQLVAF
jgi:hypothetical protein